MEPEQGPDQMDVEDEVQQVLEDVQQVLEDYDDASDNNATLDAQNLLDDPVAAENAAENAAGNNGEEEETSQIPPTAIPATTPHSPSVFRRPPLLPSPSGGHGSRFHWTNPRIQGQQSSHSHTDFQDDHDGTASARDGTLRNRGRSGYRGRSAPSTSLHTTADINESHGRDGHHGRGGHGRGGHRRGGYGRGGRGGRGFAIGRHAGRNRRFSPYPSQVIIHIHQCDAVNLPKQE